MAAANTTNYLALLREMWPQNSIEFMLLEEDPWLGSLRKDPTFSEITRHVGVGYGGPQGFGNDFETAKRYKTSSVVTAFQVSTVSYYGVFSVSGRLKRMAKNGNKSVVIDPMKTDSTQCLEGLRRRIARDLYKAGGGSIGRMTSGSTPTSSATITLDTAADVRNFEIGMPLQTSTTDGTSGSVKSGTCIVTAVAGTEAAPTVTVSGTYWTDNISTAAASDYIFPAGAFGATLSGADGWCPTHSGSPGTYKSVNRNLYANRLAGRNYDAGAAGVGKYQGLQTAARICKDAGGKPDRALISTRNWESLANELSSANKLIFSAVPATGIGTYKPGLTYEAIKIITVAGPMDVLACPDMPDAAGRVITSKDWYLGSTGPLLGWVDGASPTSGGMVEDASDSEEFRLVGDLQLVCENPGRQVKVIF